MLKLFRRRRPPPPQTQPLTKTDMDAAVRALHEKAVYIDGLEFLDRDEKIALGNDGKQAVINRLSEWMRQVRP